MTQPKVWGDISNAIPVAVGKARARGNQLVDTPYQTASGPGFTAEKSGEFSSVTVSSPEPETRGEGVVFVCYLDGPQGVGQGGTFKLLKARRIPKANPSATPFSEAAASGTASNLSEAFLIAIGGGEVFLAVRYVFLNDSETCIYRVGNFGALNLVHTLPATGSSIGTLRKFIRGGGRGASNYTWGYVTGYLHGSGVQAPLLFMWDPSANSMGGGWVQGAVLTFSGKHTFMYCDRVTPSRLLGLLACNAYLDGGQPESAKGPLPPPALVYSKDNGATWGAVDVSWAFSDWVPGPEAPTPWYGHYDELFDHTMCVTPVTPESSMIALGYNAHIGGGVGKAQRRVYLVEWGGDPSAVPTMSLRSTFDIGPNLAPDIFNIMQTVQGVLVALGSKWLDVGGVISTETVILTSTDLGVTWVEQASFSSGTLLSVRLGEYRDPITSERVNSLLVMQTDADGVGLYESEDYGATLVRRAVVADVSVYPRVGVGGLLNPRPWFDYDFLDLAVIRNPDGSIANTMPGAPWSTDSSVKYRQPD